LTIVTDGRSARVLREYDDGTVEWTPADFARCFLWWLATEYTNCAGRNVSIADIEDEFFPRFQTAAGCQSLQLGTLLRGLGEVTKKGERRYTDHTGKRCSMTEYRVPKLAAKVVDLDAVRRARA
jgi:hypothetical protein